MNTHYDIIDTAIKLVNAGDRNIRTEVESIQLEQILEADYSVQINSSRREQMIVRLKEAYSFGQLLNVKLSEYQTTSEKLAREVRLSKSQLAQLIEDKVYANNVPVKKLKRLLVALNISFEKAEKAIRKSFDMIVLNQSEKNWNTHSQLAFRRNSKTSNAKNNYSNQKSGIYENQEALDNYLEHLKELI